MPLPLHPWLLGASFQKTLVSKGAYLYYYYAIATAPLATWNSFLEDLGTKRCLFRLLGASFQKTLVPTGLLFGLYYNLDTAPWLLETTFQKTLIPTGLFFGLLLCPYHCTSVYLEQPFRRPWYLQVSYLDYYYALTTVPLATCSFYLEDLGTYTFRSLIWNAMYPLFCIPESCFIDDFSTNRIILLLVPCTLGQLIEVISFKVSYSNNFKNVFCYSEF